MKNNTYYNNKGEFQSQYDYVWEHLMPESGKSNNNHVEAIRVATHIYHEYFDSGNVNFYDVVDGGEAWRLDLKEWAERYCDYTSEYLGMEREEKEELLEFMKPDDFRWLSGINDSDYVERLIDRVLRKALPQITLL